MFEDFKSDLVKEVEETWFVNPYDFRDMILSSAGECDIWGAVSIYFSLITGESKRGYIIDSCFELDKVLKKGTFYSSLDHYLANNSKGVVIEVWLSVGEDDFDKSESLKETIEIMLADMGIKYTVGLSVGYGSYMNLLFYKNN